MRATSQHEGVKLTFILYRSYSAWLYCTDRYLNPDSNKTSFIQSKAYRASHLSRSRCNQKEMEFEDELVTLELKRFSKHTRQWRRTSRDSQDDIELSPPSSIRVLSWNIDFIGDKPEARMQAALSHIQNEVFASEDGQKPAPCCILLQEVSSEAFPVLLKNQWVRKHFMVIPTSADDFPNGTYGVVTLVSKSIPVSKAQSLIFGNSAMGRSALMVDVKLSLPNPTAKAENGGSRSSEESENLPTVTAPSLITLRLANTHLESLPTGVAARPVQLANIASLLKEDGLHGGIVCGDMNIIRESDLHIHEDAGLLDAWTGEDEEEGFTWGFQPPCQFAPGRLDRVFYTSACQEKCEISQPERVCIGLKRNGRWVTDHYGLLTTVSVKDEKS
ncbi:unnamed protein product [Somion occarium]|uniref:Endonuclease/exonuclease/phosphatase domain-containing protein n=1 Tax=Somion occarium TaxID=3059160 RepID=A0ABP1EC28_9APHY